MTPRRLARKNERAPAPIPLTMRDIMVGRVAAHAAAFEGRWRRVSLARLDGDLAARFDEQLALWHAALAGPDDDDVRHQGEAMIRGWDAAIMRMERADIGDDVPCLIGYDQASHAQVVIAYAPSVFTRRESAAMFLTPDEVAKLVAGLGPRVLAVKLEWASAEIVGINERSET